jgi:quinol-cytochrome oxidoreductase complex cytochrome b subunit
LDIAVAHYAGWRRRSFPQLAAFLVAVIATAIAVGLVLSRIASPSVPAGTEVGQHYAYSIMPAWYALPLYALLRALPNKAFGVIVMCAALLLPMIWPWMRADILRIGRTRWAWRLLCAMLAATWIGLGLLGTRSPEGLALHATQTLAIFYFAYFLVLPFALHRIAGSR